MKQLTLAVLLTTLGVTASFGSAQIWDLGEGISVGMAGDALENLVACVRYGRDLNKAAIWSVKYGFVPIGNYTPTGIAWHGSTLVVAGHLNGQAYRWNGNMQGVGTWSVLPLADGVYSWRPHRVQSNASDGSNLWIVGYCTYTDGAEHACVYKDDGVTASCVNAAIPSPGHDHSEFCAVSESGLVAGQAQYGGAGSVTSGGRQVMTGTPLRFLGNLLGGPTSANEARALAISGDGSRIVGWSYISLSPLYIQQCYWDAPFAAGKTANAIPFLPGHVWGDATAVSRTGTYVGGMSWKVIYQGGVVDPEGQEAWIWDAAHGTRDLKQVLIAEGADLTDWGRLCDDLAGTPEHGDGFFDITGISEDGRWITGTGARNRVRHAYVAYLNEPPSVSAVLPGSAPNTATVQVTLTGLVFRTGAAVKLKRAGYSSIGAFNVVVNSISSITCKFNLSGKTPGLWNVVVTNPDGESGTLENGFAITLPASSPACGTAVKSLYEPAAAEASNNRRFKLWGRATVLDSNTFLIDDGSKRTVKVLRPGHAVSTGRFVSAAGTVVHSEDDMLLLADELRLLD